MGPVMIVFAPSDSSCDKVQAFEPRLNYAMIELDVLCLHKQAIPKSGL